MNNHDNKNFSAEDDLHSYVDFSKPVVNVSSGYTTDAEMAREVIKALEWRNESRMEYFWRGGITRLTYENGNEKLNIISEAQLRVNLSEIATIQKRTTKGTTPCGLTQDSAKLVMASDSVRTLPPITTLHSAPILAEVAKGHPKVLEHGYHRFTKDKGKREEGHYVFEGNTVENVKLPEAIELLKELFSEFHFTTPADKARAYAMLITPAIRFGGIERCLFPIFTIEADDSQTGKGYFLDLFTRIYREQPSLITKKLGGVGSLDESLAQALVAGRSMIQLDNVRGEIDSQFFEAAATSLHPVPCRIPYVGTVEVDPMGYIFLITSNGLQATRDLVNRSCFIRLKKRHGAVFKKYKGGDLLSHVEANQGKYLGAIYALLKRWIYLGKPRKVGPELGEGRFRTWWEIAEYICTELLQLPSPIEGYRRSAITTLDPAAGWLRRVALTAVKEGMNDIKTQEMIALDPSDPYISKKFSSAATLTAQLGRALGKLFDGEEVLHIDDISISRRMEAEVRPGKGARDVFIYSFQKVEYPKVHPSSVHAEYSSDQIENAKRVVLEEVEKLQAADENHLGLSCIDFLKEYVAQNGRLEEELVLLMIVELLTEGEILQGDDGTLSLRPDLLPGAEFEPEDECPDD